MNGETTLPHSEMPTIIEEIPLKTVSESNTYGHWTKRHKRAKEQRAVCRMRLLVPLTRTVLAERARFDGGLVVTLTRIGPRKLDDDNVRGALKACRDGVADALGIDDGSDRIQWEYLQERGPYGVRIAIRLVMGG